MQKMFGATIENFGRLGDWCGHLTMLESGNIYIVGDKHL